VSGKNFALRVKPPVQPPQLLADLATLGAMFKNFGGARPQPDALAGRIGIVVDGLGMDLCLHVSKLVASFVTRTAEKIRRPHRDSFGLNDAGIV
jgi:hypothetical protein